MGRKGNQRHFDSDEEGDSKEEPVNKVDSNLSDRHLKRKLMKEEKRKKNSIHVNAMSKPTKPESESDSDNDNDLDNSKPKVQYQTPEAKKKKPKKIRGKTVKRDDEDNEAEKKIEMMLLKPVNEDDSDTEMYTTTTTTTTTTSTKPTKTTTSTKPTKTTKHKNKYEIELDNEDVDVNDDDNEPNEPDIMTANTIKNIKNNSGLDELKSDELKSDELKSDELKYENKKKVEKTEFNSSFQKNMSDENNISFENVTIAVHNKILFQDTPLKIAYGHRYGLIGKNGIGKTSLLYEIANRNIPIHERMDVYYMEQDVILTDNTIVETVLKSNKIRYDLITRFKELSIIANSAEEATDEIIKEYQKVGDLLCAMEADKDESRIRRILLGLGFQIHQIDESTKLLSGGWRMRVALAKALYLEPTLLLLDEPTNHLDINATIWLTNYLSNWKKSVIIVSHNQHFLNEVCTDIINIENKKLVNYRGNYEKFKTMKQMNREKILKDWKNLQNEIKGMRKKGNVTKKQVDEFIKKKGDEKGIYEPLPEYSVNINFPDAPELSRPVLECHDVEFGYNLDCPIIKNMDIGIDMDTRMTIVGSNGNGKTTVMSLLIGLLNPTKGEIKRNSALRIGYYNQHFVDTLPLDMTPISYLQSLDKTISEQNAHKYLGSIGLESFAHNVSINNLSGGQKARVVIASIQHVNPHLLFLDEPTNHLDIETIDALIDAINKFNGGVIVISHDMELITKTNCRLWVCQNMHLTEFTGDYDDYVNYVVQSIDNDD
jgi:ATP-binding cassette subfamily F protein 1